jgi:hypothetical protein
MKNRHVTKNHIISAIMRNYFWVLYKTAQTEGTLVFYITFGYSVGLLGSPIRDRNRDMNRYRRKRIQKHWTLLQFAIPYKSKHT